MKLYLIRHGDSDPNNYHLDPGLTEKGKGQVVRLANFLKQSNPVIHKISHSEKKRAQETANILGSALAPTVKPQVQEGISPSSSIAPLIHKIDHEANSWMIVGHLPYLGHLVSYLLTGNEYQSLATFQTSTAVCLERLGRGAWNLQWLISPDLLSE